MALRKRPKHSKAAPPSGREGEEESKMKAKSLTTLALAGLMVSSLMTPVWAGPPKMKMTTDIPASITAPDEVETSIGTLGLLRRRADGEDGRDRV